MNKNLVRGINHITLAVRNIEKSFLFYRNLLGFTPLVKWDQGAYFLVGETKSDLVGSGFWFCLNQDEKCISSQDYTHISFTVAAADFKRMSERIIAAHIPLFQENSSPGESLYFLDPDGHKLELHVGSVEERLAIKRAAPGNWKNVEWFC